MLFDMSMEANAAGRIGGAGMLVVEAMLVWGVLVLQSTLMVYSALVRKGKDWQM